MIEIRNDFVRTQNSEAEWAERIAKIVSHTKSASFEDARSTASRSDGRAARRA
jgi:predicted N-formylglutamate amidohydrolase